MFAIVYSYNIFQQIFFYFFNNKNNLNNLNNFKAIETKNFKKIYLLNSFFNFNFKQNSIFFILYKNNFDFYFLIYSFLLKKINVNSGNLFFNIKNNLTYNFNSEGKQSHYSLFIYDWHKSNNSALKFNYVFNNFKQFFIKINTINSNNFFNFFKKNNYLIKYSVSDFFKNLNGTTLNYLNILFLRKNKVFNKGRYSRNRQYYRTGVYWCLYINIIAVVGIYFWFYRFNMNFGYLWWLLYFFICSFFFSRALNYNLVNLKNLFLQIFNSVIWFFNIIFNTTKFFFSFLFNKLINTLYLIK